MTEEQLLVDALRRAGPLRLITRAAVEGKG
jgi:hypothetical protein